VKERNRARAGEHRSAAPALGIIFLLMASNCTVRSNELWYRFVSSLQIKTKLIFKLMA